MSLADLRRVGLVPLAEMREELAPMAKAVQVNRRSGKVTFAMLDPEDYERLSHYHWHRNQGGYVRRNFYLPDGTQSQIALHREVMGLKNGDKPQVDHINHDLLDNRRSNLRFCDHKRNHQNRKPNKGGSSKYRGVSLKRDTGKWHAFCKLNQKMHNLGFYEDEKEAARAAQAFRREHMPFTVEEEIR